jgi:hypothetical protein
MCTQFQKSGERHVAERRNDSFLLLVQARRESAHQRLDHSLARAFPNLLRHRARHRAIVQNQFTTGWISVCACAMSARTRVPISSMYRITRPRGFMLTGADKRHHT